MYAKPSPQCVAALKQAFPQADDAAEIVQDLRHLVPVRNRLPLGDRIPLFLRIEILAAHDRGCSATSISKCLEGRGLKINANTLKKLITVWKKTKLSDQLQAELEQPPLSDKVHPIKQPIANPPAPPAETKRSVKRGRPAKVLTSSNGAKPHV